MSILGSVGPLGSVAAGGRKIQITQPSTNLMGPTEVNPGAVGDCTRPDMMYFE